MRATLRLFTSSLALLLAVGVNGCQFSYKFEISGVVRSADGAPLPLANVKLDGESVDSSSFPVVTGADGTFKARVAIRENAVREAELPKWSLVVSRSGYETVTLDISPREEPASLGKTTFITVEATLNAK